MLSTVLAAVPVMAILTIVQTVILPRFSLFEVIRRCHFCLRWPGACLVMSKKGSFGPSLAGYLWIYLQLHRLVVCR